MEQISLQDTNGFLGNSYRDIVVNKITLAYNDWFVLIKDVNKLVYLMYDELDIKNNDIIGMYLLTAFSKVHKSFQSATILYSYGLEDDVHILFRTMLESLFISSSIKKDNNNYKKLLINQEIEDKLSKNHLIDIGIIKGKKEKINDRKTSMRDFAKAGGLFGMYSAYIHLCSYTHIDLRNFEKNFDKKDGEIVGVCIAPSANDLTFILTELIALMINYIRVIKGYLKSNFDKDIIELETRRSELAKRIKK